MWSNDKLPQIADLEQFVITPHDKIAPHDKQLCHVVQNCLFLIHMTSKIVMLLHMKFFAPRTMSAASATNFMYAF